MSQLSNSALAQRVAEAATTWETFAKQFSHWATTQETEVTITDFINEQDVQTPSLQQLQLLVTGLTDEASGAIIETQALLDEAILAVANVEGWRNETVLARDQAVSASESASADAASISSAVSDAQSAQTAAEGASTSALGSKDAAALSETNAAASEAGASASADAASLSETNASTSASAASSSEAEAASSASSASGSASSADASETNAASSADAAATSETNAASSAAAAATSETNAASSSNAASASADDSASSAAAASVSETNASSSESLAQQWAMELKDVEVTPGKYSSFHWAQESEYWAGQAQSIAGGDVSWSQVTNIPDTASRWPSWSEISGPNVDGRNAIGLGEWDWAQFAHLYVGLAMSNEYGIRVSRTGVDPLAITAFDGSNPTNLMRFTSARKQGLTEIQWDLAIVQESNQSSRNLYFVLSGGGELNLHTEGTFYGKNFVGSGAGLEDVPRYSQISDETIAGQHSGSYWHWHSSRPSDAPGTGQGALMYTRGSSGQLCLHTQTSSDRLQFHIGSSSSAAGPMEFYRLPAILRKSFSVPAGGYVHDDFLNEGPQEEGPHSAMIRVQIGNGASGLFLVTRFGQGYHQVLNIALERYTSSTAPDSGTNNVSNVYATGFGANNITGEVTIGGTYNHQVSSLSGFVINNYDPYGSAKTVIVEYLSVW